MHIELLWIIPVIAFGFFLFLIAFFAQRRGEQEQDLSGEVMRFNAGQQTSRSPVAPRSPESRLNEIETSISLVTQSLSDQQKMIERFRQENTAYNNEIGQLKEKLRDLYKEYDIVLSENYSLRAKVKMLIGHSEGKAPDTEFGRAQEAPAGVNAAAKVNMRLYDDTRLLNPASLDDTSEIDLSELR